MKWECACAALRHASKLKPAEGQLKGACIVIRDFKDIPKVKEILKKHAYKSTVISALIESARLGGVLPSCSSLWLKKTDRNLFYIFNNLGRHVSWIEVVGFWSHYINEKKVGAPFPYPKVDNGVEGVDDALHSSFYNYVPLEERD